MPATRDHDLLQPRVEDPLEKWAVLEEELRRTKFSPLDRWKEQYSRWKNLYARFREIEETTLYTQGEDGHPSQPSAQALRFHGQVITLLLQTGEANAKALLALHLDDREADERPKCQIRIETLLAGLRESLDLWRPADEGKLEALRNLFS